MPHIRSILIPVDFSADASIAIAKTVNMFPAEHTLTIHLLYVQQTRVSRFVDYFSRNPGHPVNTYKKKAKEHLEHFKQFIVQQKPCWKILIDLEAGDLGQENIIVKAEQLDVDLIIIGKSAPRKLFSFRKGFMPGKLSFRSAKPVLAVRPGSISNIIRTVVIPVSEEFPQSKLSILEAIIFHAAVTVRLVIYKNKKELATVGRQLIFDTFRTFKTRSNFQVTYETISGKNKAKALLDYCEQVSADVLIVYPGAETRIGRWFNSQLPDLIQASSGMQVLSVAPA